MSRLSIKYVYAAIILTTAMSWGLPVQAADLKDAVTGGVLHPGGNAGAVMHGTVTQATINSNGNIEAGANVGGAAAGAVIDATPQSASSTANTTVNPTVNTTKKATAKAKVQAKKTVNSAQPDINVNTQGSAGVGTQ